MKVNEIVTERLILQCLDPENFSSAYLNWLNDPTINRFLEVRLNPPKSIKELQLFIQKTNSSRDEVLLGIHLRDQSHIGNIKIGPIDSYHGRADIGIVIGEKSQWGKGIASEAITAVSHFAFETLRLNRLTAGLYGQNVGSMNAFLKAGFSREATLSSYWNVGDGMRDDEIIMALICNDH